MARIKGVGWIPTLVMSAFAVLTAASSSSLRPNESDHLEYLDYANGFAYELSAVNGLTQISSPGGISDTVSTENSERIVPSKQLIFTHEVESYHIKIYQNGVYAVASRASFFFSPVDFATLWEAITTDWNDKGLRLHPCM